MMARSLVLCSLIALAQAYTTFQTNCTAPSTSVNFVSSNKTRGTIDILWSCLFTVIACTWTVQHLNVPEQRENRDEGCWGDIKWAFKRTRTSAIWMLLTAIAHEVLISKSLGDLAAIKQNFEKMSQLAKEDEVPWTRTHSLFANTGGFVIRCNVPKRVGKLEDIKTGSISSAQALSPEGISNGQEPDSISRSRSYDHQAQPKSHEKELYDIETQPTTPLPEFASPYHLIASDLIALREAGFLLRLPYIATAELNDKNKSDSLVRFIAIVQIVWMVTQIIVRASRRLAISQLEIAVVAFAICAIVIYGLNWEKPKGVQTPYTVLQYRGAMPRGLLETVVNERKKADTFLSNVLTIPILTHSDKSHGTGGSPGSSIPNHFSPDSDCSGDYTQIDWAQSGGLLASGMVFSAVHILAWDFVFPTLIERKLWWASSIISTIAPLLLLLFCFNFTDKLFPSLAIITFFLLFSALYIASRVFLIIEIFRTLCFLPPSAYVATWAANVPHIA